MSDDDGGAPSYNLRSVQTLLGLSRRVVTGLIAAGFVQPSRGPRNEYVFSFRDAVLLRTAHRLQAAQIPPRKILRSLASLRRQLPAELPLTGLRISAVGSDIAVRDGAAQWAAETGQMLLDFEVAPQQASVAFLERLTGEPPTPDADSEHDAPGWFAQGVALEARADAAGAEAAYRAALTLDLGYRDAYLNLGVLLADAGRWPEAVALYDVAIKQLPADAMLHFNRAVALEDGQRWADALAAYQQSLRLDATLADAHYNAARLHERLGQAQQALRHFSAYRRLVKVKPGA